MGLPGAPGAAPPSLRTVIGNGTKPINEAAAAQSQKVLDQAKQDIDDQQSIFNASQEFARASTALSTAHGIAAKVLGLTKQIVQGYLGVA